MDLKVTIKSGVSAMVIKISVEIGEKTLSDIV
jgi:hypothetical protein